VQQAWGGSQHGDPGKQQSPPVQQAWGGSQHGDPGKQQDFVVPLDKAQLTPPTAKAVNTHRATIFARIQTSSDYCQPDTDNETQTLLTDHWSGSINTTRHNGGHEGESRKEWRPEQPRLGRLFQRPGPSA
jgi:hypothetical protein